MPPRKSKKNEAKEILPVIVLGSGVAGLTASIYLADANIGPVHILGGPLFLGALSQSAEIRNWPGTNTHPYPSGLEVIESIYKQVEDKSNIYVHKDESALSFKQKQVAKQKETKQNDYFEIHTNQNHTFYTWTIIVATGSTINKLNLPNEDLLWGHGISSCVVCDGFAYHGKNVAVIGGGDSAIAQALQLSKIAKHIYVIVRNSQWKIGLKDETRVDELHQQSNVTVLFQHQVVECITVPQQAEGQLGNNNKNNNHKKYSSLKIQGVIVNNTFNKKKETLNVDGLFYALGSKPNTDIFLKSQLQLGLGGEIKVKHPSSQTSIPGIFACGDVADRQYIQAITASAGGCAAALDCKHYLISNKLQGHQLEQPSSLKNESFVEKKEQQAQQQQHYSQREWIIHDLKTVQDIKDVCTKRGIVGMIIVTTPSCHYCKLLSKTLPDLLRKQEKLLPTFNLQLYKMDAEKQDCLQYIESRFEVDITKAPTILGWTETEDWEICSGVGASQTKELEIWIQDRNSAFSKQKNGNNLGRQKQT